MLHDPRTDAAYDVLDKSYPDTWSNPVFNKALSETLPDIYDACVGDADEDPVHRMGNAIWNYYPGGTTAHSVAQKIVNEWDDRGLI